MDTADAFRAARGNPDCSSPSCPHNVIAAAQSVMQRFTMLTNLVMTVIGADRPGLVQLVSACVADHGGNWLESRMCRLGGQFAGILSVEVPEARADELTQALARLEREGLRVIIHADVQTIAPTGGAIATLELVGHDRPGILRSVSGVLAAHGVNVEELASERVSAPMGGGTLFQARATIVVPAHGNLSLVRADLEKIAADLMVDLKLQAKPTAPMQ